MRLEKNDGANILVLGYLKSECKLHDQLLARGHSVVGRAKVTGLDPSKYELIISFGLRDIIHQSFLDQSPAPVVNLHMSLLPLNRGAHPLFWSLFNHERIGVTIHEIDSGLDTGPIVAQKEIDVDFSGTFRDAHHRAKQSLEDLLLEKLDSLLTGQYSTVPQAGPSSFHKASELPLDFQGWDSQIDLEIERLRLEDVPE